MLACPIGPTDGARQFSSQQSELRSPAALRNALTPHLAEGLAGPMVSFPLLLIPLAIYNIIVWLMPGVSLADPVVKLTLVSGAEWPITPSDILLALSVLLLLLEVIKGARPGAKYLTDHLLSLVLFGVAAAEFVLWPKFGTSTYFLLTLLELVEFLSGVSLHARRGPRAVTAGRAARQVEPAVVEPAVVEPTHAPPPPAASVEDSAPVDRSEPKPAVEAGPTVTSPDLQPSSGASTPSGKP